MLKNNKFNLLISIVCAIVLWAYITTVVNPDTEKTISSVPVDLININALNDRGFTVDEGVPLFVDVTVSGARSEVNKLQPSDFKATADMTGYRKGTHSIPVNVIVPNNMELTQVRPEGVQVEVVDLITVFKPVRIEYEDTFALGQEPGFLRIMPEEMEVSGVTDDVDSIDYIRVLVPVGYLTEEISTFRLDVVAVEKDGSFSGKVGLSQNSVEITGMLCYTKRVPLRIATIGEPNEEIEVTDISIPRVITIRGAMEDIEGVSEVEGVPVDLSSVTTSVEFQIDDTILNLPEGIEVASASEDLSVRIEVQGIARKEFVYTADMIEIINLVPSMSGHVNTGRVTVTVLATRDVLDGITRDDIKLYIDALENIRVLGSIEMDVIAECSVEVKDILIEPAKVRVTLIRV